MNSFSIYFSFDKTIGNINGRVEVYVSNDDVLSNALHDACAKVGIACNEKFQVNNINGVMLDIIGTIEFNDIVKDCNLMVIEPGKDRSMYGYYNMKKKSTTNKLWIPLAVIGLAFSISGLIVLITIYAVSNTSLYSFSVVIDAGSTSSKIYLYSWPSNKFLYNGDVTQVAFCKTDHGISFYEADPSLSFALIKQCLDIEIMPNIPQGKKSTSYIFLGATAGMRMLSFKNPNATKRIMDFLRQSLKSYALKINNTKTDISIIPGTTEGLTGWITVNYLLDNFPKTGGNPTSIIGAMDMGGASTQVTFIDSSPSQSNDTFSVQLYGRQYRVYSHSYLCYGKSQAELRLLAVLIHNNGFNLMNNNSCMLKGERAVFNVEEIFFKPCIFGKFAVENYGYEIVPPQNLVKDKVNFTFVGTSNHSECSNLISSLFNETKCFNDYNCTFNGVYQPKLKGKFGAFSAYPLIKEHLNPNNENFNLTRYKHELNLQCDNRSKVHDVMDDEYAKWHCFDLTFLIEILVKLGFNDQNWKDIDFIDKIKNYNIGWSLGYMIEKTAMLPKEKPLLPLQDYLFGILFVVLLLILVFAIIFFVMSIKNRKKKWNCDTIICDANEDQNLLSPTSTSH